MVVVARIGATTVVFGLVTLLDHPPETTCFIYFIYNIVVSDPHAVTHWVVSGGWSRGVPRPKTTSISPILAKMQQDHESRNKL